jgi:hypothetical protein
MPVHDWTRVLSGTFHDFHQAWITEMRNALNAGLLPEGYYALAEQVAGGPHPDVLTLEAYDEPWNDAGSHEPGEPGGTSVAVAERPPQVRYTLQAEESLYAAKADRVAIYHASGDRVVAFVEIVSPGNKHSHVAISQFLDKLAAALAKRCHLVVIDLHPPGTYDSRGVHAEFWGSGPTVTAEEPLSLAAYCADSVPKAYFEPICVGAPLPDMPLFLTPERYVNLPLEPTYMGAWRGVPARWKRVIEAPQRS